MILWRLAGLAHGAYMVPTWTYPASMRLRGVHGMGRTISDGAQGTRFKFTRASVDRATCPEGRAQAFFRDTEQPALRLRVTASGAKAFVFEQRLAGKTVRVTIGPDTMQIRAPKDRNGKPLSVGADTEAARLAGMVAQGIHPLREKEEQVKAQTAKRESERVQRARLEISALEAWAVYCQDRQPHWGKRHHADHLSMVAAGGEPTKKRASSKVTRVGILRGLLDQPLAEVGAVAIEEWVATQTKVRPTRTALAFRLLRGFLNWCVEQPKFKDVAQHDAHRPKRIRERLTRSSAKSDVLGREMLRAWFSEVNKLTPAVSTYLQVLLLTGCRPGEALDLRWSDVDFQWQRLTLRDKVEGERVIPLTPHVASLLRNLRRINSVRPQLPRRLRAEQAAITEHEKWAPSPWVFVSQVRTGGRIADPSSAHGRALNAAGVPHLTLHGLRRSFGTLSEWVECPVGIVAQIQGHKPSAIAEKHYRVRPLDLLRQWHTRIESWILNEAGLLVDEDPKLVTLRSATA
jgi:integrase